VGFLSVYEAFVSGLNRPFSREPAPDVAADADGAPISANGTGDGWRCSCGAGPHASLPYRCAAGHPTPGNDFAMQHGAYRRTPLPDVRADVEAMVAGIVSDLGGESELSTLQRRIAEKLAGLEVQWQMFAHDIAVNGVLTPSGGVRRVHEAMLSTFYAWERAAQRLGLERRAKRLPRSISEAVMQAPEVEP